MHESAHREGRRHLAALLLMLPAGIPYLVHFLDRSDYSRPSGFIQWDMPLYMAKAREPFDEGRLGVLYGNPCDGLPGSPRLYFQPWTFALGLTHHLTGADPGLLFVGFWFIAAWSAARVALAMYESFVGLDSRAKRLGLVAFCWGGGVLAVSGAAIGLIARGRIEPDDLTALDPFRGWWFLNLGRNLVYPTEALYHALAFGSFLAAARGRVGSAIILLALTAACSPFAGLEAVAVLGLFSLGEMIRGGDGRGRSASLLAGVVAVAALILGYYLVYLDAFAGHRIIARQMALGWRYSLGTALAAYGPVAALAGWRLRSRRRLFEVLGDRRDRLLLAWAVAAFALENHDWVVAPRQPIHFTRGYAWTALFLLGAPSLLAGFEALGRSRRPWGRSLRLICLFLIVADNATWLGGFAREFRVRDRNGVRLTSEQDEVLRRLDAPDLRGHLLISQDERLSYLALARTSLQSWVGHALETPDYRARRAQAERLFARGEFAPEWSGRALVVLRDRLAPEAVPGWTAAGRVVFRNRRYAILQFRPDAQDRTPSPAWTRGIISGETPRSRSTIGPGLRRVNPDGARSRAVRGSEDAGGHRDPMG